MIITFSCFYRLQRIRSHLAIYIFAEAQGKGFILLSQVDQVCLAGCLFDFLIVGFTDILKQFLSCLFIEIRSGRTDLQITLLAHEEFQIEVGYDIYIEDALKVTGQSIGDAHIGLLD